MEWVYNAITYFKFLLFADSERLAPTVQVCASTFTSVTGFYYHQPLYHRTLLTSNVNSKLYIRSTTFLVSHLIGQKCQQCHVSSNFFSLKVGKKYYLKIYGNYIFTTTPFPFLIKCWKTIETCYVCPSGLQWWSQVSFSKTYTSVNARKTYYFRCNKLLSLFFKKTDNTTGAVIEKTVAKLSSFAQRLTFDKNENMEDRRGTENKKTAL